MAARARIAMTGEGVWGLVSLSQSMVSCNCLLHVVATQSPRCGAVGTGSWSVNIVARSRNSLMGIHRNYGVHAWEYL